MPSDTTPHSFGDLIDNNNCWLLRPTAFRLTALILNIRELFSHSQKVRYTDSLVNNLLKPST